MNILSFRPNDIPVLNKKFVDLHASLTSKAARTTEVKSAMTVDQMVESISLSVRISLLLMRTNGYNNNNCLFTIPNRKSEKEKKEVIPF